MHTCIPTHTAWDGSLYMYVLVEHAWIVVDVRTHDHVILWKVIENDVTHTTTHSHYSSTINGKTTNHSDIPKTK